MYRSTAILIGILFLVCTAATLLSYPFGGGLLEQEGYLGTLADKSDSILSGSLLETIWAFACAGIAIGFYRVIGKCNRFLAMGAVAFRTIEAAFVLIGTLCLVSIFSLSQDYSTADAAGAALIEHSASVLTTIRFWSHNFIASLGFGLGALMYYLVLYKYRLIPTWLSVWGALAAFLSLVATGIAAGSGDFDLSSVNTILNIPIGLNELVLAVWLIVKGFNIDQPVE